MFSIYPNKYRSDLSKKLVFDPAGQRASKLEALKVSSDRESNPDRPKTKFTIVKSQKIAAQERDANSFLKPQL